LGGRRNSCSEETFFPRQIVRDEPGSEDGELLILVFDTRRVPPWRAGA